MKDYKKPRCRILFREKGYQLIFHNYVLGINRVERYVCLYDGTIVHHDGAHL